MQRIGTHTLGVRELPSNEMTRHRRDAIAGVGVGKQIKTARVRHQALEEVHPRTGCIGERFGHERHPQSATLGDRADHLPGRDDLVGQPNAARVKEIEFLLPGTRFMVGATDPDVHRLEGGDDFVSRAGEDILADIEIAGAIASLARAGSRSGCSRANR